MKLADAGVGSTWRVTGIASETGELQNRLYSLGIYPGVEVRILRIAPMGDPLQAKVGGTLLSIRRQEALAVEIEALGNEAGDEDATGVGATSTSGGETGAMCPS